MTDFTFIHAADLHLGSPFAGLALKDEEVAIRFAQASRAAFEALVDEALRRKVAFMVIAGDVYDGDWPDHAIGLFFNRQMARLDRAGIPVFLVKGNHDAASLVTKSIVLPASTREFPTRKAATHRLDDIRVAVHGRSFQDRAVDENLALTYPAAVPGWFNIGVLHTSCAGHPNHASYAPCSVADLQGRGYDYWALGHVHDYAELARDPPIVFPGNLQGRNVRECGPRGAVLVEVAAGRVAGLTRLVVDRARWAVVEADLSGLAEMREMVEAVEAVVRPIVAAAENRLVALRIRLHGETDLHGRLLADREGLVAEMQAAAHRAHDDVWLESVKIATTRPRTPPPAATSGGVDPAALLHRLDQDSDLRADAARMLADILARLPAGMADEETALADELDTLFGEAEAMVLARLDGRAC